MRERRKEEGLARAEERQCVAGADIGGSWVFIFC